MAKEVRKLKIRSFKAVDDLTACLAFSEGYAQVVYDQGINSSYINSYDWVTTSGIYGILIEHEEIVIGGVLLFLPSEKRTDFPFTEVVGSAKSKAEFPIKTKGENYAELFAMWHSNSAKGWGLSYMLLKAGLALSLRLKISKTFYLAAEYNLRLADKLSLKPEKHKGFDVYYTLKVGVLEYKVYLYQFSDSKSGFGGNDRHSVFELAEAGACIRMETVLGNPFEIDYDIGGQ